MLTWVKALESISYHVSKIIRQHFHFDMNKSTIWVCEQIQDEGKECLKRDQLVTKIRRALASDYAVESVDFPFEDRLKALLRLRQWGRATTGSKT
jgi:hypothetical protein